MGFRLKADDLFGTQRGHGIDRRGPAGRQVPCEQRRRDEDRREAEDDSGVARGDAKHPGIDHAAERNRQRETDAVL